METTDYTLSDTMTTLMSWGEFKNYECYDALGRIRYVVPRFDLNSALIAFEEFGTLYRGVWELRIGDAVECIEARLNEQFQFDGKEKNWRRPDLVFYSLD